MVKLINIEPQYERILSFLYPSYSLEENFGKYEKFILKKDIGTPNDLRKVRENYQNAIIISTKLYDELWDDEVLRDKALEFRRVNFKSRKRTLSDIPSDDPQFFIDNLISFMFTGEYDFIEDEGIMELFQAFGSLQFSDLFMKKVQQYPLTKVVASMFTFLSKVNENSTTVFYKRKYQALGTKLNHNFLEAFDYLKRHNNYDELSYLMFFQMLVK